MSQRHLKLILSQMGHLPPRTCFSSRAPPSEGPRLSIQHWELETKNQCDRNPFLLIPYLQQPHHPVSFTVKMPLNPSASLQVHPPQPAPTQATSVCGTRSTQHFPHFRSSLTGIHWLSAAGLTAHSPNSLLLCWEQRRILFLAPQALSGLEPSFSPRCHLSIFLPPRGL